MKYFFSILLVFTYLTTSSQNSFSKYWESRIYSNVSFAEMNNSIKKDSFDVFYNKNVVPKQLIDTLTQLMDTLDPFERTFCFANPTEKYNSTDEIDNFELPYRQIIMVLKNKNYIFITYKHGGFGAHNHILWAKIVNNAVADIWVGTTSEYIDSIDKFKKVLLKKPEEFNYFGHVCF
jgi:hypothetical protein